MIQTNTIDSDTHVSRSRIKPRFKLIVQINNSEINAITEVVKVHTGDEEVQYKAIYCNKAPLYCNFLGYCTPYWIIIFTF